MKTEDGDVTHTSRQRNQWEENNWMEDYRTEVTRVGCTAGGNCTITCGRDNTDKTVESRVSLTFFPCGTIPTLREKQVKDGETGTLYKLFPCSISCTVYKNQ